MYGDSSKTPSSVWGGDTPASQAPPGKLQVVIDAPTVPLKMPVATVRYRRLGSALAEASALKSNVPGRWQTSHSRSTPGNFTSAKESVVLLASQVNGTVR